MNMTLECIIRRLKKLLFILTIELLANKIVQVDVIEIPERTSEITSFNYIECNFRILRNCLPSPLPDNMPDSSSSVTISRLKRKTTPLYTTSA